MMRFFILIIPFLFYSVKGYSQTKLFGIVVDSATSQAIPFATIAVYDNALLITGTSANEDGEFSLSKTKKFTHLEVSFVGYESATVSISRLSFNKLNEVKLKGEISKLNEFVVKADKVSTQMQFDRKIINLGSDLQQDGVTALEAIDQIPEIQADLSTGSLSLRGSDEVRVLVNGKPTGQNAGELLSQIPASGIERIEVITTPSARESANGLAGIINIVLKKGANSGLNLKLNSGIGTKRHSYGLEGNYNLTFLNFRFLASKNERKLNSKQSLSRFFEDGSIEEIFTPHNFNGQVNRIASGLDVFLNDKNVLSFDVNYTEDTHDFFNNSSFSGTRNGDFQYLRESSHFHYITTFNGNYRHTFLKPEHFLEVDYNLNVNNNFFPARDSQEGVFLQEQEYDYDNSLQALSADYTIPFDQKVILESGVSWNRRKLISAFDFEDIQLREFQEFNYNEDIFAAYALLKSTIETIENPKKTLLNWQAGLRLEKFQSGSENSSDNAKLSRAFLNLFPSVHITYPIRDNSSFTLGYSRRVSRPNFRHVNPFQLGSPYFRFRGNPNLNPEFSNNVELSYNHSNPIWDWMLTAFYRKRRNVIQAIESATIDGIQEITYQNLGKNTAVGIELNSVFAVNAYWDASISGNYYFTHINELNSVTWNQLHSSNIQIRNSVKLGKRFSMDLTYRYNPRRQSAFSYVLPRNRVDWAVRVKLISEKLSLNLRIVDVLNRNLMKRRTIAGGFKQDEVWRFQSQTRGFLLNVNYRISNHKTKDRKKKKRSYEHGGTRED